MAERGAGTTGVVNRLELMGEVLRSFADATTDYARLLDVIAERTATFLGHYCSLRLLSADSLRLVTAAMSDPYQGEGTSITPYAARPLSIEGSAALEKALSTGKSILVGEGGTDQITLPFEEHVREGAKQLDVRSAIIAPLTARGQTFGALFVLQRGAAGPTLSQVELELAEALATHAALAISNARMLEELSREVEQRKQAQSSLATVESARQHEKSIVDTISQPLVVLDRDQNVRDANRTFHEIFRTTESEVTGRPFAEIAGGAFDTPRMRELLAEVLPVRTNALVKDVQVEISTLALGRRTVLVNARKMYRPGNGTDTLLLALEDVTERIDAAEKLQRRSLLLESMNEAVIAGDMRFRIEEWNPAAERLFGWTAAEVTGRPIEEVLNVAGIDREKTRQGVRSGATMRLHSRIQHRDGHWLEIEFSSMPVLREGVATGFVSVLKDVTEQLRLEQEAQQRVAELQVANKELESFSYSVSHDLRAPVRAISGFARLLYEDHAPALDVEARRLLGVVRKNADKMGMLIDDLLDFSRMGRQAIALEELDMAALVREELEEARRTEPDRELDVRVGSLPLARADRVLVGQVWQNLLTNAIKYTRPRSPAVIEISGEATRDEIAYHVKDNGVGFDMRFADKLFKVFERLHNVTEFEGTGVGLALVDRIVRRHGGRVWAEAELGAGATFHFSLPRGIVPK